MSISNNGERCQDAYIHVYDKYRMILSLLPEFFSVDW